MRPVMHGLGSQKIWLYLRSTQVVHPGLPYLLLVILPRRSTKRDHHFIWARTGVFFKILLVQSQFVKRRRTYAQTRKEVNVAQLYGCTSRGRTWRRVDGRRWLINCTHGNVATGGRCAIPNPKAKGPSRGGERGEEGKHAFNRLFALLDPG